MSSPHEGKQGRHPKDCLCNTHMAQRGVQPVAQPIAQKEVSPMTLDPNVLSALASMPEALASYIQSQTAAPVEESATAMPITAMPTAPVMPEVQPTNEIVIPLSELVAERPKKGGFYRFVDGRANLPAQFSYITDAVRLSKLYISPKTGLTDNNVEIVIRRKVN